MQHYFDTKIQQTDSLGDIYYMSCNSSQKKRDGKRVIHASNGLYSVALVIAMNIASYEAEAKVAMPIDAIQTEMVAQVNTPKRNVQKVSENIFVNLNLSHRYSQYTRRELESFERTYERFKRIQMILDSYRKNLPQTKPNFEAMTLMRSACNKLSKLEFIDAILQYDGYDDAWRFNLYFADELELSVGVYSNDDEVDFSVYHHQELIVSNAATIKYMVKKLEPIVCRAANV